MQAQVVFAFEHAVELAHNGSVSEVELFPECDLAHACSPVLKIGQPISVCHAELFGVSLLSTL